MKQENLAVAKAQRIKFTKPVMTKRRVLIGSGIVLLAAGAVFAGTHRKFIRHLYADPHEFMAKVGEEVFDFDEDDAGEEVPPYVRPPAPKLAGLPNFGRVTDTLYRGGQPTPEGYRSLQRLGVQVVVDFRPVKDEIETVRQATQTLGIEYVSIPWTFHKPPDNKQVAQFLKLVLANPGKRIFAHCRTGHDKTGVMIAAYRMGVQHWTPDQALAEMRAFGFLDDLLHFWHFHVEEYVEKFPRQLATDPDLRNLQLPEQPAHPEPSRR